MAGFADGFSAVSSAILQAKRLKADREEEQLRRDQRAKEIEQAVAREEKQREFEKGLLADRIAADVARDKRNRLWQMEDNFDKLIENSRDRSLREKVAEAQIEAARRAGQPRPLPPTALEQTLKDIQTFDDAKKQGIAAAVNALNTGDIGQISATQSRLAHLSQLDPTAPKPEAPRMGVVEIPYGQPGLDDMPSGKAKFSMPVEEIRATLERQQPGPASAMQAAQPSALDQQALAWARANPGDPRAAQILRKLGLQ